MRGAEGRQPRHANAVHYKLTSADFFFRKGLLCSAEMAKALTQEKGKQEMQQWRLCLNSFDYFLPRNM